MTASPRAGASTTSATATWRAWFLSSAAVPTWTDRTATSSSRPTAGIRRLVARNLFSAREIDFCRRGCPDDRRYLLFNPITKMKVTTEGEKVIDDLWDVIAAKGFEKDTVFEMATRDIRALPKLEGTVHVNMALVLKFMANYLFNPAEYPPVPQRRDAADDEFLFRQGPAKGLGKIKFNDWRTSYAQFADVPNVARFMEQ